MPVLDGCDDLSGLRATLETAPNGIAVTGSEGTVQFANPAFARLHGQDDASALLGRGWRAVFDHRTVVRIDAAGLPGADEETRVTVEDHAGADTPVDYVIRALPGSRHAWHAQPAGPANDTLERYETILKNIHDGVYTLDATGQITWVNETAIEEFDTGYTRDELIGAPVSKVLSDEDIEKCLAIIRDLIDDPDRDSGRCQIDIQTAHGDIIPCDLHLGLLPGDGDEFPGTVGVLRDISDRRRREQRLTVLNRVLRHNLRNDLNVIIGWSEVLERQLEDTPAERAARIRHKAQELTALGDKARAIEQALEGGDHMGTPIDIVALVTDRVAAFRRRFPDATIQVSAPETAWVRADELLATVMDNLLENALVHHDRDRPTVTVDVDPPDPDGDRVTVRVTDDGPGIATSERVPLETGVETNLEHGSGLGLWLCKWLVDRYRGTFSVEQVGSRGTTAVLRLPAAEPSATEDCGATSE